MKFCHFTYFDQHFHTKFPSFQLTIETIIEAAPKRKDNNKIIPHTLKIQSKKVEITL